MAKFAKWIGGGLGWAVGGPIGALLGFALGTVVDKSFEVDEEGNQRGKGYSSKPGDFGASLLVLVAAVMKADGKVLKVELDYVKRFFNKQFGSERTKQHLLLLRDLLKQDIPLEDVCIQIRTYTMYPARLQLLHLLFGVAASDSNIDQQEINVISRISSLLGIQTKDYESIKAMFFVDAGSDYKILEIEQNATEEEIKKAYRRMAVKYHPDKVSHMGEEYKEAAKEKFQKVQQAYENIKKSKGIK